MHLVLRCVLLLLSLLSALSALCGTKDPDHDEGVKVMAAFAALTALAAVLLGPLERLWALRFGKLLLLLPLLGLLAYFGIMLFFTLYALLRRAKGTERQLLVLGTAIEEDRPAALLLGRLEAARRFLSAHPEAKVIVSGGQVGGEILPEAEVMSRWLTAHGVAADRITAETGSRTTYENFIASLPLLRAQGFRDTDTLAVVTDVFHFWRASQLARRAGYGGKLRLIPGKAGFFRSANWYFREVLVILLYWTKGPAAMLSAPDDHKEQGA